MTALVIGLLLFLGVHSTRMVADGARSRFIERRGPALWRGLYSLASAVGLALIVWGFAQARQTPWVLWSPPPWTRPLASLSTLLGFVLIAAAYVPRNHFKTLLGHPMVMGTMLWALGHLLATRTLADVLLFGGFLAWAVIDRISAGKRPQPAAAATPPSIMYDVIAVVVGLVLYVAFAFWAHPRWIGVPVMPA